MIRTLSLLLLSYIIVLANGCPRGSFRPHGSSRCVPCGPGTYQSQTNATNCLVCAAGAFQPLSGAQSPDVCRSCPAGTFSTRGSASCTPCPDGTSSGDHSDRCVTCPPGTRIAPWAFRVGDQFCETCPYGYADERNLLQCKPCPPGTSAPPGSTSIDQCAPCPPGTASDGTNTCRTCDFGTVSAPDSSACNQCPEGSRAQQLEGSTSCVLCKPGQYGDVRRHYFGYFSGCHECPENTTSYASGARFCRRLNGPCPRGYLQTSSGDCERCNFDERFDVELQRCVPCASDEGSVGGLPLRCAPCADLINARVESSKCVPIGNLEFPDARRECAAGYAIHDTQHGRFCEPCTPGFYSARINSSQCLPCPHGTISDHKARSCEACPRGTIPNGGRTECVDMQTNCPIGTSLHVDTNGYPSCVSDECSVSEDGTQTCPPCTGSYYSTFSFDGCEPCPGNQVRDLHFVCGCRGTFAQNLGVANGICSECPVGSYGAPATEGGDNECVACPAGTYRVVATFEQLSGSVCPRCSPVQPCKKCPAGFVSRRDGATECERCPPGTFSYGVGDTECLSLGAASSPVEYNDPLDLDVKRELERLPAWL